MSEAERAVGALLDLMARLRDPEHGCPWDRAQSFATIAPYTIEEAYEVADAIEHGDREHLREELGDLLFQVVFHARIAQERGWFDFTAVADGIREKLVRRHPHLFAGAAIAPEDLVRVWEEQKAQERAAATAPAPGGSTVLAGVPRALPALIRAAKLGRRAARVGFDWPDAAAVRSKVVEGLQEIGAALRSSGAEGAAATQQAVAEELGDLLFAVVNWSRHLHIDAETALRAANDKFE
ncbi:MAG: nucleoside triphosphate pyrophosphohydrolase, partial [Gammaproteobacteria bacterium]|nr:nucleoside triphosphate pyrophosphohydrolase [Gammaproteobacteria bacterium]